MKSILLVAIGGAIGSSLRYFISTSIPKENPSSFPWATFAINLVGCLLIGLIVGYLERANLMHSNLKPLLIVGLCGGFTTFSAFTFENIQLLQSGNYLSALLYSTLSVTIGIAATFFGIYITTK